MLFSQKSNMKQPYSLEDGRMKSHRAGIIILAGLILTCCTVRPASPIKPQIQPTVQSSPSAIPTEKATELPSPVAAFAKIYLIALDDNGISGPKVGCGDSLVAVETRAKDARTALQLLLENRNQYFGQSGLYNALYQSDLKIERFETKNGNIEVDLSGSLLLGGECDNPRVETQLKSTTRQSSTDNSSVIIRINGKPLEELLSGK
jgi:hypothetical protein